MQSLQEIMVKSRCNIRIVGKYFMYRRKHGSLSVPKACLTEEAVQLLCRLAMNKNPNDHELSTVVTVIMCLSEFAESDKDKQSWLKLSDDVYWLLDKCLGFMYRTTQEITNGLLEKFLPTLSMICANGHPLSTLIFSEMTRPLIALSLREATPKNKQAIILDTIEQVLLKSSKSAVFTTLSKIGLYMNALSSLVFKVSVETQLSILSILSHAAQNKDDAVQNAKRWFAPYPKIQRAFLHIYCKAYSEASGEFLSAVREVTHFTPGKPEITLTVPVASKNMRSSVCPTENPSNIHSKSKDRLDVKLEHSGHLLSSVRGKMSRSDRTIIPHDPFVRLQESAGAKSMPAKFIPAYQSKLLPTATKLRSVKISGESVSKIETLDSQKTISFTSNVDQKFQDHKVQTVSQDVLPVHIEKQVSNFSDNQQARSIHELYRINLLSTPYYPNRQRSLSLKSSSTLEDEVMHEKQMESIKREFIKEEKDSESQTNQHQAPPQKQKENEQKCEGRNLKNVNTLTQEHKRKQIKETAVALEQQLVQERKEQSSRNHEMMKSRSNVMKPNISPTLLEESTVIDLEPDLDGMERIKSWIESSTLYSKSIDDEIIVLNAPNSALSKPQSARKRAESEIISEGKKCSPTRPDETVRKHRKCDQLDVAVPNKLKERQVNIISANEKVDKCTTWTPSLVGTTKISSVCDCSDNSTIFRKPEGRAIRNHASSVSNKECIKQTHEMKNNTSNKNSVQKQMYDTESNCVEKNVIGSIQNKKQYKKDFHERASPECVKQKFQNLEGNEDCLVEDKKLQDFQLPTTNPLNVLSKNTKYGIESKPNAVIEVKESKGEEIPSCTAEVFPKGGKKRLFLKSGCDDSQISAKREKRKQRFFLVKESAIQVKQKRYQPVVRRTKNMWESRLKELDGRASESKVDDVFAFHDEPKTNGKGVKNKRIPSKKCEKKESCYVKDLKKDHKNTFNLLTKPSNNMDKPQRNVPRLNYTELSDESFKSSVPLNVHCQEDEIFPVIVTEDNSLLSHKQHGMKVQDKTMKSNRTVSAKDLDSGVDVASNVSDDITTERRSGTRTANLNSTFGFDYVFRAKLLNEQLSTNAGSQSVLLGNMESLVDQLKLSVQTAQGLVKTDDDIISEQKLALQDCINFLLGSNKDNTI